ncbi:MAG TPA: NAD(+)/NADH kinase [Baekduia sp.]|nr:NAD(+)/NADH kinase [Baekduia sp.]
MALQRIGLVLHPRRDTSEQVREIAEWGVANAYEVVLRTADRDHAVGGVMVVDDDTFAATVAGLISLGGDGTMLGALRLVAHAPVPVLGVNMGHLGFLAEIGPDDLPGALDRLRDDHFTVEPHSCLEIRYRDTEAIAFNDVAISRVPGTGSVQASMAVDRRRYGYYRCDALIVATPTGSTAYSYSAGGPVVSPGAQGMLVTPASPGAGISRPLFLCAQEELRLELLGDAGRPALEVDGIVHDHLGPGDVLDVRWRKDAGLVVRLDPAAHQERQRLKLSLLDLPLLPDELRELAPPPMAADPPTEVS